MELVTPSLGLLVWTSLIFLILFIVLRMFAWSPILQALKEREQFIEDALSQAEKAKEEMAKLTANNEQLLHEARLERDKIMKDAHDASIAMIAEAKEKANLEANRMIENARIQIQNEKNSAIVELKNLVATTSVQIAELLLKKELNNDSAQKDLIQNYIKESKLN
ncbi:MAG: F0F1 ATP synthase subunit B [Bacteroidota bacterium]|nr:F0F1 ATP synthase subunit B [Bacteroidota bacterium]